MMQCYYQCPAGFSIVNCEFTVPCSYISACIWVMHAFGDLNSIADCQIVLTLYLVCFHWNFVSGCQQILFFRVQMQLYIIGLCIKYLL